MIFFSNQDLNRRVVKTEWAEIRIPEIDFEITKQSGLITTVEGIIDRAITGLRLTIQETPRLAPSDVVKISNFVLNLEKLKRGDQEFTFILDDPTGNSFIENLMVPNKDPQIDIRHYARTIEQNKLIGILPDDITDEPSNLLDSLNQQQELLQFTTNCTNCKSKTLTNMKVTKIPHFKEIVLMVTLCERCGYKTNEIKSGGGIGEKGVRYIKKINDENDLTIDLVRSDTCSIEIPELELRLDSSGTGQYTTIEGLIKSIKDQLKDANPFFRGDSEETTIRKKFNELLDKLDQLIGLTIVLDDPCGNSFIERTDQLEHYERTHEQNEELGLNDMKTENYS